jgi:hypothetical protein
MGLIRRDPERKPHAKRDRVTQLLWLVATTMAVFLAVGLAFR